MSYSGSGSRSSGVLCQATVAIAVSVASQEKSKKKLKKKINILRNEEFLSREEKKNIKFL